MFCCTESPDHAGEIVTSICQNQACIERQSQLCCSMCIRESHASHAKEIESMKQMLPDLLDAHNLKNYFQAELLKLCTFIHEEFNNDQVVQSMISNPKAEQGGINTDNVVAIAQEVMLSQRRINREENKKIKEIEKTLQVQQNGKINHQNFASQKYSSVSPGNTARSHLSMNSKGFDSVPMAVSQLTGSLDTFSQTMKHPYVSLSPESHSAFKNSPAGGYKLAVLSSISVPVEADNIFFNVKIEKSSGKILLGLAIPEIVKQREFLNVYGSGQGAFLIGQNGNDPCSAILFHHCDNMFNRKEIVGWNFKEGEVLGVGLIRDKESNQPFISFRMYQTMSNGRIDQGKVTK